MTKDYSGMFIVPHVTQAGETYEGLARAYSLPNYLGILEYNHMKGIILDKNVKKLLTGRRLLIPRSPKGYEIAVKKIESLQIQLGGDLMRELAHLDENENLAHADEIVWDFAGDALTALAGLGVKGFQAANKMVDRNIAANLSGALEESAFDTWHFYNENAVSLLDGVRAAWNKTIIKGAAEKVIDKGAELVLGKEIGKVLSLVRKVGKASNSLTTLGAEAGTKETLKAIRDASLDKARAIVEYMGYMKVSKVAETALIQTLAFGFVDVINARVPQLRSGSGSIQDTTIEMKKTISAIATKQIASLQVSIDDLNDELDLVWG